MRRLINYLSPLLLGAILGMIFLAIIAVPTPHGHTNDRASGIVISYQVIGEKQQKTVLLIAGKVLQLSDWPPEFCGRHFDRQYRLASPIVAIAISPVSSAKLQRACALKR